MANLEVVRHENPTEQFLDYLYEDLSGFAYAPTLNRETGQFYQKWFRWPEERNEMVNWILGNTQEKDVYVSPALFKSQQLSRDSFKYSNVVWTEFDGNVPSPERLGEIPQPTLRIISSYVGFEHWYWKLKDRVTSPTQVESVNRSLTYTLGADASSWDCTQILRIPGTLNHKKGTQVYVVEQQEYVTEISAFVVLPDVSEPDYDFTPDNVPDVSEVVLSYAFPKDVITLYRTAEFPVGERSSALMRLGYSLAEMGLSDGEIFSVLRNADDRWKKFAGRQDRDRRLVDLISKARIKYPAIVRVGETSETIQLFGWRSLLESTIEIEWLIPELLQASGYLLLTGESGVGKTQFSLYCAIKLALGKEFLGFKLDRQFRILVMSLEMGHGDIKYFMSQMSKTLTDEELEILEQNIIIAPVGEPMYLDQKDGQDKFENLLGAIKPDIFIWDSIGSSSTGDISAEGPVKTIMGFNDKIRQKYQVASWYIHHNRKATADNRKPNKLSDVYGNQYLVNRATSVYCLWPAGDEIEVIPLKKRLAKLEKPWGIKRNDFDLSFDRKSIISSAASRGANVLDFGTSEPTDDELENKPNTQPNLEF